MHKLFAGVVVAGLLLVGCGNDDEKWGGDATVRSEEGACVNPLLTGKAAGEKCAGSYDCAEVCCNCASGGKSYSTQVCFEGKCATAAYACERASQISASYCGQ